MPKTPLSSAIHAQREDCERTAASYDVMLGGLADEHGTVCRHGAGAIGWPRQLRARCEGRKRTGGQDAEGRVAAATIVGLEPVAALRQEALRCGLSSPKIRDEDALCLEFGDGSFD